MRYVKQTFIIVEQFLWEFLSGLPRWQQYCVELIKAFHHTQHLTKHIYNPLTINMLMFYIHPVSYKNTKQK